MNKKNQTHLITFHQVFKLQNKRHNEVKLKNIIPKLKTTDTHELIPLLYNVLLLRCF